MRRWATQAASDRIDHWYQTPDGMEAATITIEVPRHWADSMIGDGKHRRFLGSFVIPHTHRAFEAPGQNNGKVEKTRTSFEASGVY